LALVGKIVEIQGEFVSDIRPPDDSLSSYFDELLGGDVDNDSQFSLPLVVGENLSVNSTSKVVNLNSRNKTPLSQVEKKPNPLREAPKPTRTLTEFAEPDLLPQDQEKKQKLEKLLQTAQQQFLKQEQSLKQEQKVEPQVQTEIQIATKTFVEIPDEIQDWPIETATEIATDHVVETNVEVTTESPGVIEDQQQLEQAQIAEVPNLEWAENGLPQWAQDRFDVLLFDVAGLTLAVPLISLGQIYPLTDELTPLFGQADWFMGLQPTPMGKIRTVNTAKFVMPEKYNETLLANAKYVMSLNGVQWGLALDSVAQPMRLHPDQVKWRSDRSKRPWLAGTVKEHMCALLDVPRIAQLLLDMDKNHQRR
jgi:purine-binding chemotaxis protein CheW